MKDKIRTLSFKSELKELLEKDRILRNDVAHNHYELNENDENLIDVTFGKLMLEPIFNQISPLNLKNIFIEEELKFIDKNQKINQIRGFLNLYIHEKVRIQDFHNRIYLPLLEKLEITRN